MGMRPVCFLSDFGFADDFVGTCKGVMLGIVPGLSIVDLTHDVPGFGIEPGAETLQHATRYMPSDTVYLAVVDPGVGTDRRGLALRTNSNAFLVGPDNGLLIPAAEALEGVAEAVVLDNTEYQVHPVSNTFHGRDIFAPAAAHLASGVALPELGTGVDLASLTHQIVLETPGDPDGTVETRIIDIDRFGNARLSIRYDESGLRYGDWLRIEAGDGQMSVRYLETFGSSKAGELMVVPDSHWRLSLCINQGNASHALALKVGGLVRLTREGGTGGGGA